MTAFAQCVGSSHRHSGTAQGPWVEFRERGPCGKQEGSVLSGSVSFLTANPRKLTLCEIQYFGPLEPAWEHGVRGQAGQRMAGEG